MRVRVKTGFRYRSGVSATYWRLSYLLWIGFGDDCCRAGAAVGSDGAAVFLDEIWRFGAVGGDGVSAAGCAVAATDAVGFGAGRRRLRNVS